MTCDPEVEDENVYCAEPPERFNEEDVVVPSTTMVIVPVGVVVTLEELEATVIVTTSLAPEAGVAVAADKVVTEGASDALEEDLGQAVNS